MLSRDPTRRIQLTITLEQAEANAKALALYTALCQGKLDEVSMLARLGHLPTSNMQPQSFPPKKAPGALVDHNPQATPDTCTTLDTLMVQAKALLGYGENSHHGISHPHIPEPVKRAHEVFQVLDKAIAEIENPNPPFRHYRYLGVTVRYADGPAPDAMPVIESAEDSGEPLHVPEISCLDR
ncbi:hypothetical protein VRRI112168_02645 [Vreelandella rituensis]|uniref:Uncharacterized protein n=1 Tax=Vreelandella rituensis TaxID=2282306 RepID=A0A368UD59_9GAMM|nr:hypothetical protein [Halomonas rituensis]RCV93643.1 hypothetical protein DU506_00365 [Halomonas rituensis]